MFGLLKLCVLNVGGLFDVGFFDFGLVCEFCVIVCVIVVVVVAVVEGKGK